MICHAQLAHGEASRCSDSTGTNWIPVTERRVWEYVQWLQNTQAAPTKASTWRVRLVSKYLAYIGHIVST